MRPLTPGLLCLAATIAACDSDMSRQHPLTDIVTREDAVQAFTIGCPGCQILSVARMDLPVTKRTGWAAKALGPDTTPLILGQTAAGETIDPRTALANERAARATRDGKVSSALRAWQSSAGETEGWVWIRLITTVAPGIREAALKDSAAMAKERSEVSRDLEARKTKVNAWLAEHAGSPERADDGGPVLRARLKARTISALALLPEVAELGIDAFPGKPSGDIGGLSAWNDTIHLPTALRLSTGVGHPICVKEAYRPDTTSWTTPTPSHLTLADVAVPGGATDTHSRLVAGLLKNYDVPAPPWNAVAPNASIYLANWTGYGPDGINDWCVARGTRTLNYAWTLSGTYGGGLVSSDWAHDWLVPNYPYMVVVASAGTTSGSADTVANRGYNSLVVGGVLDQVTSDRSDDVVDPTVAWRNPATPFGDYELPHVVAPSNGTTIGPASIGGPSAATTMVSGISALVSEINPILDAWPETKRAIIIATATGRANTAAMTQVGTTDRRIGAGIVSAERAAELAISGWDATDSTVAEFGHLGATISASSFGADGFLTARWKAKVTKSGRLRVVMTWDSIANCTSSLSCSSDPLSDLDLYLYRKLPGDSSWTATGLLGGYSTSWDSSWEMADVAVTAGEEWLILARKNSFVSPYTYLGLAWYQYALPSGEVCTADSDCTSESCVSGRCTCVDSSDCLDGRTCSAGSCRICGGPGQPCCDGASVPACGPKFNCSGGVCAACPSCTAPGFTVLPSRPSFRLGEPISLRAYLPNNTASACKLSADGRGVLSLQSLTRDGVAVLPTVRDGSSYAGFMSSIEAGLKSVASNSWSTPTIRSGSLTDGVTNTFGLSSAGVSVSSGVSTVFFPVTAVGTYQARVRYIAPTFVSTPSELCPLGTTTATVTFLVTGG